MTPDHLLTDHGLFNVPLEQVEQSEEAGFATDAERVDADARR